MSDSGFEKLENVLEKINTGLDAIKRAPIVNYPTDIKCLRIQDISQNKSIENWGFTEVKESDFEKYRLRQGEIFIARTSNSIGVNRLIENDINAVFNNGLARLRVKDNLVDPKFLFYVLQTDSFRNYIYGIAFGTSAQPNMKVGDLGRYEFKLLSKDVQQSIAHILGTLDNKIELNQKMNQTLEDIAKAIFKSWFVDFDPVRAKAEGRPTGLPPEISDLFPDELVDSEIGEIPKGWEIKRVEEICEKIAMGPFGSNIKVSTFVDDGIPIISGHHLHNFLLREGDHKFITEEHAERLKNSLVRSGDVIFTHAGTVGQVSLIPTDSDYETYVISQRQFYARPLRPEHSAYLNFFFHSPVGQHKLLSNVSGSGVPSIARPSSHLKAIELTLADEHLVRKFDQLVGPMIERMVLVSREIETLAELRDTLLPKLISGELRIPDAEKFLKEAGI